MIGEKVTAEVRGDGAIVLIVPDEDSIDIIVSAFMDGETCCRAVSEIQDFDEESRDMAREAAECLERLGDIFGKAMGGPPKRPELRWVD